MSRTALLEEATTRSIIGAFFEVARSLRFGLLESLYATALEYELNDRGHRVGREVWVPVRYKRWDLGRQRLDMVVDERVVVEVKSSAALPPTAKAQLLTYLRCTDLEVGLLLHFGPSKAAFERVIYQNVQSSDRRDPDDLRNQRPTPRS